MAFRTELVCRKEFLKRFAVFFDLELFILFYLLLSIPRLICYLLQCSRTKDKRVQIVAKKIISPLGDRTVDREDSSESMGSGSSSEDKVSVVFNTLTTSPTPLFPPPFFSFLLVLYCMICILSYMLKQATDQKLKVTIPEMKRQTMADRFQETLGATFLNDEGALVAVPKSSG